MAPHLAQFKKYPNKGFNKGGCYFVSEQEKGDIMVERCLLIFVQFDMRIHLALICFLYQIKVEILLLICTHAQADRSLLSIIVHQRLYSRQSTLD